MSIINQSVIENVKLNLTGKLAHNGSQPTAEEIMALVQQYGFAAERHVDEKTGAGETAVSQMLTAFTDNGLVRDEPATFGVPASSFHESVANIDPRTAMLAAFNTAGVTHTVAKPFGTSIDQVVGITK